MGLRFLAGCASLPAVLPGLLWPREDLDANEGKGRPCSVPRQPVYCAFRQEWHTASGDSWHHRPRGRRPRLEEHRPGTGQEQTLLCGGPGQVRQEKEMMMVVVIIVIVIIVALC